MTENNRIRVARSIATHMYCYSRAIAKNDEIRKDREQVAYACVYSTAQALLTKQAFADLVAVSEREARAYCASENIELRQPFAFM